MERLTYFEHGRYRLRIDGVEYAGFPFVDRLAAYEDTGLTPEEINALTARIGNNEPLTMDELREMDGEPIWMTIPGEDGGEWAIVHNIEFGDICLFCPVGAKRQYGDGGHSMGEYGKTWLAYRRKPGEKEGEA